MTVSTTTTSMRRRRRLQNTAILRAQTRSCAIRDAVQAPRAGVALCLDQLLPPDTTSTLSSPSPSVASVPDDSVAVTPPMKKAAVAASLTTSSTPAITSTTLPATTVPVTRAACAAARVSNPLQAPTALSGATEREDLALTCVSAAQLARVRLKVISRHTISRREWVSVVFPKACLRPDFDHSDTMDELHYRWEPCSFWEWQNRHHALCQPINLACISDAQLQVQEMLDVITGLPGVVCQLAYFYGQGEDRLLCCRVQWHPYLSARLDLSHHFAPACLCPGDTRVSDEDMRSHLHEKLSTAASERKRTCRLLRMRTLTRSPAPPPVVESAAPVLTTATSSSSAGLSDATSSPAAKSKTLPLSECFQHAPVDDHLKSFLYDMLTSLLPEHQQVFIRSTLVYTKFDDMALQNRFESHIERAKAAQAKDRVLQRALARMVLMLLHGPLSESRINPE